MAEREIFIPRTRLDIALLLKRQLQYHWFYKWNHEDSKRLSR